MAEAGLEEQEPCRAAAPYPGMRWGDGGDEEEEEEGSAFRASPRDGIYAGAVALWLGRAATSTPPTAGQALACQCIVPAAPPGTAAGNSPLTRPGAAWGTEGGRHQRGALLDGLPGARGCTPCAWPKNMAKNTRVQACSKNTAQIIRFWSTSDHRLALPRFPHQDAVSHPSYVNAS